MIETLELENFKSHRNTKLVFDDSRLHAIVGQNSSGKTSILQSLYYFNKMFHSRSVLIDELSFNFITSVGQDYTLVGVSGFAYKSLNASEFEGDSERRNWRVYYEFTKRNFPINVEWQIDEVDNRMFIKDKTLEKAPEPIRSSLKYMVYLKLVASNLAKAEYSDEVIPKIEFNGSGLAPTLDYIRSEDPDRFQALQEMLRQIVPSVKKVEVRRAKVTVGREKIIKVDDRSIPYEETQEMLGQEVYLSMASGDRIPAHAISEGTMLTLGLLTVLMNPNQPKLVLLDDVEQGLHPKAQRELMTVFKKILEMNEDLQIIFTTHSPYIIDEITPSQVHVLSATKSGFTKAKRLDEHPDVEWARQTLTTGEFWDAEGEDWVMDGEIDG